MKVLIILAVCASITVAAAAGARDAYHAGRYHIESQMLLPHLEEMRRISEHQSLCVGAAEALGFFPVALQPALRGCALVARPETDAALDYVLVCKSVNGASGYARLAVDGDNVKGVLEAKMGGKNMTFSQHVTAQREGDCAQP